MCVCCVCGLWFVWCVLCGVYVCVCVVCVCVTCVCVCVCRCFVLDCKLSRYRPVRARLFVQGFGALCEVCLALLHR